MCGKGGYVRAIARDLGEALGCLGHVKSLRRIWSGPFDAAEGASLEQIEDLAKSPEIDELLMPLEIALQDMPEARVGETSAIKLRNGNPGEVLSTDAEFGDEAWASHAGEAVAVGVYKAGHLHPSRVFVKASS